MTNTQLFNIAWATALSTLVLPMTYLAIRIEGKLNR